MVGVCAGSDLSAVLVTGTGSLCVVGDSTGIGLAGTVGGGRVAAADPLPFLGAGFVASTGDIRDQNGPFDYESYEGTLPVHRVPVDTVITHSYGSGQQKQRVDTVEVLMATGVGAGYTRGKSYTGTWRWDIFD
jgi:hypothetical protein